MTKEVIHALILIFAIILTFVYPKTDLTKYDLQISAGLFIFLYFAKKWITRPAYTRLIESVVFTLIILGIINSTGGTNSPFFFLIYFLLFSLSLILEPIISITTTICLIIFFLLSMPSGQDFKSLLPIISLAFLTPFAMLMGQEHLESKKEKIKNQNFKESTFIFLSLMIKNLAKKIRETADNFVGDHDLSTIRKTAARMEKLIEKYEKNI